MHRNNQSSFYVNKRINFCSLVRPQVRDKDDDQKDEQEVRYAVSGFNPLIRRVIKNGMTGLEQWESGIRAEIFDYRQWNDKTNEYEVPEYLSYKPRMECQTATNTQVRGTFRKFFNDSSGSYKFSKKKNDKDKDILVSTKLW